MKRFSKWWWILPWIVLGAAILFAWRGCWSLSEVEQWKAAKRAQGERFSLADVAAPLSTNTLAVLEKLGKQLDSIDGSVRGGSAIESMRSNDVGKAEVTWSQSAVPLSGSQSLSWDALAEQLDLHRDVLAALREVLREPAGISGSTLDPVDPLSSGGSSSMIRARQACHFVRGAALRELHRGALAGALEHLRSLVVLSHYRRLEPSLVVQMIRTVIADLGLQMTWEALQAPGWTEAELAWFQTAWMEVPLIEVLPALVEGERALGLCYFDLARTNRFGPAGLLGIPPAAGTPGLAEQIIHSMWRTTWSVQDEMRFLHIMDTLLQSMRRYATNRSFLEVQSSLDKLQSLMPGQGRPWDRMRYQVTAMALPNWGRALGRMARVDALRQLAVVALACRRFHLRHQRWPDRPQELIPEFLSAWPRDPMDGRPLRFRPRDGLAPRLYGVGPDGRDDGGTGGDVIWPDPVRP